MDITEETEAFRATTKEAINLIPTHFNVALAAALASTSPENTKIDIHIVAGFEGDEYSIVLEGEQVQTNLQIYSRTCIIAGWSIVAVLRNTVSPIVF